MCGIAGFFDISRAQGGHDQMLRWAAAMGQRLTERGPDAADQWVDEAAGIALAHRRLSIVDLSEHGLQPMASADGRYVTVYNGEVYNFRDLREELARLGHGFRGQSDTEVILAACVQWGVEAAISRLNGMFALAIWDKRERRLVLARDHLGIKPLYWARIGDLVLFASQPKALLAHPGFQPEVNPAAVRAFVRLNYVPAPLSIFRSVSKLEPGHLLIVDAAGAIVDRTFWNLRDIAQQTPRDGAGGDAEAIDALDQLLRDSVRRQMVADVPLGAFLSGGIDSTTVVALMQAQSNRAVKTFTIGFDKSGYDEATHAAAIARHLGTDHHELYLTPQRALDVVPRLAAMFDEPFADSSQIPTFLVSEMARQHVTVSLSGDGGDELFAGYNRYVLGQRTLCRFGGLPRGLRIALGRALRAMPVAAMDALGGALFNGEKLARPGEKLRKLGAVIGFRDAEDLYRGLAEVHRDPGEILATPDMGRIDGEPDSWVATGLCDAVEHMQYADASMYLPDDILTKVDRASMAVSLECRVPILDHRVAEFAWRLRPDQRIRNGNGKWILRQVLARYVPPELTDREKMGFSIPVADWLRGPLREWAESLISKQALDRSGFFCSRAVQRRWQAHVRGRQDHSVELWGILMAQAWAAEWKCSVA